MHSNSLLHEDFVDVPTDDLPHFESMALVRKKGARLKRPFRLKSEIRARQKGIDAERGFLHITKVLIERGMLPWAQRVRRASRNEDLNHGIDFKIDVILESENGTYEREMLIQIKSSYRYAQEFLRKHPASGIYVVIWNQKISSQNICRQLERIYLKELKPVSPSS